MSIRVRRPIKKFDVCSSMTNTVKEVKAEIPVQKRKKNEEHVTESSVAGTAP